MKGKFHYEYTKEACTKFSFSEEEAEEIASSNVSFDRYLIFKPWAHFKVTGAFLFAYLFLILAKFFKNLKLLGWALHSAQDAVAHGKIAPWNHDRTAGIDEVERGSAKEGEIIKVTRKFLKRYKA